MASALSHPLLCIYSPHQNRSCFCCSTTRPYKSPILKRTANSASRLRAIPGSSPPKDHVSPLEDPAKESKVPIKRDGIDVSMENPKMNPSPSSSFLNSDSRLLRGLRMCGELFKIDNLGLEILSIAVPAALSLAADPIASLVDTAFVGHIGSVELAAVGVSISVFNLVSKLFNIPLLNITTSFVAEEQALVMERIDASSTSGASNGGFSSGSEPLDASDYKQKKRFLPAVSTSLALAAGIGIAEATALSFGSGFLMNIMGIPVDSPMRLPAEHFLTLRALGAPPVVVALAAQGTFRGFMDTKTPLFAIGAGNFLNAILDFILIFLFGIGIGGAAIATVISEYLIAFILLWELNTKVVLLPPDFQGRRLARYLTSGGLLIGRTIAVLGTMTLSTSMAAQEGPIPMAGHQICLQVWLAISLLNDALALAGQALLASSYSQGNYRQSRIVIYRVLQIGLVTGVALAVILFLAFGTFSGLFSTDTAVLEIACSGVLFVAGSQPMNALAFVFDGLYYGVSDFAYAAYSMVFVGLTSSVFLLVAAPMFGLAGVWAGLFLFMTLRVAAGFWRLGSQGGPWKMIWLEMDRSKE
ncbi:protein DETOXIFICATION 44, chloroplastic isoform X2 [Macadamia integrifolia]|uniref:protein DETOXIFICATION 44, chloroplastic isoform X2 n=1 Tax=Macadamia integrifolia TaxID=60698 RepID=UPI001C4E7E2C|nr:protein DETOXIFICATION 44, chloroplastic isoform X2 [Macadamia integrifolia]